MITDNKQPITVALADDHQLLRESLAMLINSFANCQVPYSAGNGLELIAKIEQQGPPDVMILDMSMPQMDGHQTALWLQQHHPGVKILMLTMHNTDVALVRLIMAGAKGFLKKDISPAELQMAINEVVTTGFYLGQHSVGQMVQFLNNVGPGVTPFKASIVLTDKQEEFLKLCCGELSYRQIAQAMCMSPHSIDTIRDTLFTKLNVGSRIGLALFALKNGIAPL
jgi:two-component system, NarL family, invasion response regulator UvrY